MKNSNQSSQVVSLKFGGTSMGTATSIRECANIVKEASEKQRVVVTVSAVSGVTNRLLELIDLAKNQKPRLVHQKIGELEKAHRQILESFFSDEKIFEEKWQQDFAPIFEKLNAILHGTSLVGDLTLKMQAKVCSFGECLSSFLLLYALDELHVPSERIHSEKVIRTDSLYLEANVNFKTTAFACKKILSPLIKQNIVPIVTGFIGKDTHGDTTLLGRGGSDYTASILAVVLQAAEVQIWTDVDGVMSADPRFVKKTISWPQMGMKMMSEMAYGGAKVVHPRSIWIAISKNIPVYIYNTFNRNFKGTKILFDEIKDVKGIVSPDRNILFHIENPNMLEEVGFIAKVTTIVEQFDISIDVCSTSETSFTFSIAGSDYDPKLLKALSKIGKVKIIRDVAKISMIGHGITNSPKIFEETFKLCYDKSIPIQSISVGASQRNITLMVAQNFKDQILNDLHNQWITQKMASYE